MTGAPTFAGGWYADAFRRHELRFHDGTVWTEHVSDRGVPGIDTVPLVGRPRSRPPDRTSGAEAPPLAPVEAARVVPEFVGPDGDLLGAPLLVVDSRARAVSGPDGLDYSVRDPRGLVLGTVRSRREGLGSKLLRLVTSDIEPEVSRAEVLDRSGSTVLALHRPARLLKPRITVAGGDGRLIGSIVPRQVFTQLRCTLESATGEDGGPEPTGSDVASSEHRVVGALEGESASDPNMRVADRTGEVVARVSRTWEVLAPTHHPERDTYIVEVFRPLSDPLRSLALAALLCLETMVAPDVASPASR